VLFLHPLPSSKAGLSIDTLIANQALRVGDHLESTDARFSLTLHPDGNLVLYRTLDARPLWATHTDGYSVTRAVMQPDGNFVLYTSGGEPVWASRTGGNAGSNIKLQTDGNLVVYNGTAALWATGTTANQFGDYLSAGDELHPEQELRSPNFQYSLKMQGDGNLVLYRVRDAHPLWATGTASSGASVAKLQGDGNLVLSTAAGDPIWASGTGAHVGVTLKLQDDGNVVLYRGAAPIWASETVQGSRVTTRWAIVIVTQTGMPRSTSLPPSWFEKLFTDGDGVDSYYRQMSGGRQSFSCQVFGPYDMYTPREKAALVAKGANAESDYLRATAQAMGIPTRSFDRFCWVIDQPGASGGTVGGGDLFIAARHVTQQIVVHEMAHAFGVAFEGDVYTDGVVTAYGDPFCPMDRGPSARSFQNRRLVYDRDGNNHQTSGPVICAGHIFTMGWLDYATNVREVTGEASDNHVVLAANQGSPAVGDRSVIALAIKPLPRNSGENQYWVEYRAPVGFDRFVDRPVSTNTVDMPQGALVMHEVRREPQGLHVILVEATPASAGNALAIPGMSQSVEIVDVDRSTDRVTLRTVAA
jgi:hypothetical protein